MRSPKLFSVFCALILVQTFSAQEIKFKELKQNFGFVHEGEIVSMQFEFQNIGDQPLIISDYKVECGCTVMEKPLKPILPKETSFLKITFDTHNKYDRQDRNEIGRASCRERV